MADYKLEKVKDLEGDGNKSHYVLTTSVNGADYSQHVMLPTDKPEQAAQEYADDYENSIKERDQRLESERKAQEEEAAKETQPDDQAE